MPGLRYTGEQTKGACILPKVFVIVNNNNIVIIVINFVIIVISLIVL